MFMIGCLIGLIFYSQVKTAERREGVFVTGAVSVTGYAYFPGDIISVTGTIFGGVKLETITE